MEKKLFGKLNKNAPVYSYRLENGEIFAEIITFGAAINKFGFLDGKETNLVGSFDTLDGYLMDDSHQGAIIGRVANRIKNAKFTIEEKTYLLPKNDGENCLHGGNGFDFMDATVEEMQEIAKFHRKGLQNLTYPILNYS